MDEQSIDRRISFHDGIQVMEVDFSDITFDNAEQVNSFYDRIEQRMAQSGRDEWFFLVNYRNCRLTPPSWVPFANRGKKLNLAHSLGSVRFEADEATRRSIEERSKRENFDANLVKSREDALARIASMKR
ncbi:MAG: hypothetical protein C0605_17490 [Hyphomicrobiales bacterium]|nr:MAG: hypothetical protein C0605_17490 [Hyphomicrobiales bacterium]